MLALCDAGCGKTFSAPKVLVDKLDDGIEKNYIRCSHCQHEYVYFYTDAETRKLQEKMVHLHRQSSQMKLMVFKNREMKLREKIKQKMDALRQRIEGGSA